MTDYTVISINNRGADCSAPVSLSDQLRRPPAILAHELHEILIHRRFSESIKNSGQFGHDCCHRKLTLTDNESGPEFAQLLTVTGECFPLFPDILAGKIYQDPECNDPTEHDFKHFGPVNHGLDLNSFAENDTANFTRLCSELVHWKEKNEGKNEERKCNCI
jgi:hypothetical protein